MYWERITGLEPVTSTLARWRSSSELHPRGALGRIRTGTLFLTEEATRLRDREGSERAGRRRQPGVSRIKVAGFLSPAVHMGAFGPARTGCLPLTKRLLYLVSYEGLVSSVRYERTLPAPRAGASWQLGYEDIGAAVRCRSGPPALRRRGRSRARRRRCPPWIRTTTIRAQNAASCQLDQRASVRRRDQCGRRESNAHAAGFGLARSASCLTPAWCAARGSNSVPWGKGPVHHPSCLRRLERHTGVEPTFPVWRTGTLTVVLMPRSGSPRTRASRLLIFTQPLYPMS
jgi:hypothetical protein